MFLHEDFLDFNNLIMYTPTVHQLEYPLMYHGFNNNQTKIETMFIFNTSDKFNEYGIEEVCTVLKDHKHFKPFKNNPKSCQLISNRKDIQPSTDIDLSLKTLIVDDGLITKKNQSITEEYFILGKHNSINSIYLSQSFFHLPLHCIRENSNFIIFICFTSLFL